MLSLQEDERTQAESAARPDAASLKGPSAAEFGVRERVFFALLFGGIEDALVATSTTWRTHVGASRALGAGFEALFFLAFPLVAVGVPLGFLLSRRGALTLHRHLRIGLSGERPENEGLASLLYAIVFAAGVGFAWRVGFRASDFQSPRVATLVSTLAAVVLLSLGAVVVTSVVGPLGSLVRRLSKYAPIPAWIPVRGVAIALVFIVTFYVLLPASHAITPAAAVVGFALGPEIAAQVPSLASAARLPLRLLAPLALLTTLGAGALLKHLSNSVQMGVLARAPYASIAITTIRRAFDRDHDGYSPILGGGDCDDHDAAIHPNARDVPDNGVDENCSGADSRVFTPTPQAVARDLTAPPLRDNILLIHIDALRPDHVGFAGYRRPTTPHLDRWREGATWFQNAYTPAPSTRFALSMIFTGLEIERIPQERGSVVDFTLLPDAQTLAERLGAVGYDRVGYTLSYVIQHIHELGQGFRVWQTPWAVEDWQASYQNSAQQTTDAAMKYLAGVPQDGTKPYLMFLHYECTHDPYIKHLPWDYGDSEIDRYDSAINYCDEQIARLLDDVDARGDKDRSAVFVYSDHGELFGEHGYTRHGNTLLQPDVRVLLLAKIPGGAARTIATPMLLTDMTPTIYELTGLPPDPECQAWDLLPYLKGTPLPPRPLFLYTDLWRGAVHFQSRGVLDVDGRTKFVRDVSAGMNELFDLRTDPDELSNIADAQPAERDRLAELVDSWGAFENKDNKSFETVNKEQK